MTALKGIRIVEFAGIGPGPFCGMMLADHGAEIIRIDRVGSKVETRDPLLRSRKSLALNLKDPAAKEVILQLIQTADGLIEGFRPGVMERLGLGPAELLGHNQKLVYGRMPGWGQTGPYAASAGHDINYIALSGALHQCGRAGEKPTPPVNYLGDFGGGGMMLAFGMVTALLAVKNGANGQVIDCAMTDGSALLTAMTWGWKAFDGWQDAAGVNELDTGAFYYDTYETKDGKFVSIGSLEPQFYALLREKCGLDDVGFEDQKSRAQWPELKAELTTLFRSKTRDEWDQILEFTDACYAPVLSMSEATKHAHNVERGTFLELDGVVQPAPAPALIGTPARAPKPARNAGADSDLVMRSIGYDDDDIATLRRGRILG